MLQVRMYFVVTMRLLLPSYRLPPRCETQVRSWSIASCKPKIFNDSKMQDDRNASTALSNFISDHESGVAIVIQIA